LGDIQLSDGRKLATSREQEGLYDHLRTMLCETGFIDAEKPAWMVRAFRNIFDRSGLDARDIRILRGMFSDFDWYLDHCLEVGRRDGPRIDKEEK
jgi:tRNA C32,U32 (ribose-2'-O)-methylase TrmJ